MKIAVLIAGVLDPKWPIEVERGLPRLQPDRMIMSPFDESALEIALRLRDADAGNEIVAIVQHSGAGERLARAVAAFRIDDIGVLDLPFAAQCDPYAIAATLAHALPADADLVIVGREFGDGDDGAMPALFATLLGRPFFGRVQDVKAEAGRTAFLRETSIEEEAIELAAPMIVSVTNDRRNRLRKPLMKNVMAARSAHFHALAALPSPLPAIADLQRLADVRERRQCQFIDGTPATVAAAIVDHLRAVIAP